MQLQDQGDDGYLEFDGLASGGRCPPVDKDFLSYTSLLPSRGNRLEPVSCEQENVCRL